jgi:hypothetical protein
VSPRLYHVATIAIGLLAASGAGLASAAALLVAGGPGWAAALLAVVVPVPVAYTLGRLT